MKEPTSTSVPGKYLLPPLERALARIGHTALVSPDVVQRPDESALEKVFGDAAFISLEKLKLGFERCKAVARVETPTSEGFGTGFAVPGGAIKTSWGKAFVFVTNAHVISTEVAGALAPRSARITFHALRDRNDKPFTTLCGDLLYSSPPDKLDCTVVRLKKQPVALERYQVAPKLPALDETAKVYVIGHPRGGGMMFSLQDNKLLDYGAPPDARVHYRAPTEPGSSGSPVFNVNWELVALHHAGSATMKKIKGKGAYEANEGISIQAIRNALGS